MDRTENSLAMRRVHAGDRSRNQRTLRRQSDVTSAARAACSGRLRRTPEGVSAAYSRGTSCTLSSSPSCRTDGSQSAVRAGVDPDLLLVNHSAPQRNQALPAARASQRPHPQRDISDSTDSQHRHDRERGGTSGRGKEPPGDRTRQTRPRRCAPPDRVHDVSLAPQIFIERHVCRVPGRSDAGVRFIEAHTT